MTVVEDRWRAIADKIRGADQSLNVAQKLCEVACEVFGTESVSLALVVDSAYSPIASSDSLSTMLDETQFALGDGPSFDEHALLTPNTVSDIHDRRSSKQWPAFSPIAHKHKIRGVFAFPLRIGSAYLGVLTAYRPHPGDLSADAYADGLILASLATAELVLHQAGISSPELAEVFEPGVYDQSALQLAAGMVAESLDCSIVSALVRIRARAFADDRPVGEIARAIVARDLVLEK